MEENNLDLIPCYECRQCNRKGKPSVMRGSAYCDSHVVKRHKVNRLGLFERFKDFIFQRRYDEKTNQLKTTKGFRESWWYR